MLVAVHSTTVNRTDCGFRSPESCFIRFFTGLRRPRRPILGIGVRRRGGRGRPAVTRFAVGDRVFGVNRLGTHAEYVCVRESARWRSSPRA